MPEVVTFDEVENPDSFMEQYLATCPGKKKLSDESSVKVDPQPQCSMERGAVTVPNYSPKQVREHQSHGWRGRNSNHRTKKKHIRKRA